MKGAATLYAPGFVSLVIACRFYKLSKVKVIKGKLRYLKGGKNKQLFEYTPDSGWFWVKTRWLRSKINHKRIRHLKNEKK
jgi:hypothetical protein